MYKNCSIVRCDPALFDALFYKLMLLIIVVHIVFERRHDSLLERRRRVGIEVSVHAVQNASQTNTTSNQLLLDNREVLIEVVVGQVRQILIRSVLLLHPKKNKIRIWLSKS